MSERPFKSLQIEDDMKFHKREWFVQRVGRLIMFACVIAAALGLFGSGMLAKTSVRDGILKVDYQRFCRVQRMASYEIYISETRNLAGKAQRKLWLPNDFIKEVQIEHVEPEPSTVQADSLGHTYIFETAGAGEGISVFFQFRHKRPGMHTILMRADDKAAQVILKQWVYP
jgi:hypothetical protein